MTSHVLTGLDVFVREDFAPLHGQRIGLVTNHTGLTGDGRTGIDVLYAAPNVTLTTLFGPEHGIRGEHDMPNIGDTIDRETGLTVYSLYGAHYAPTPEQLADVDTLVFDIQDIGCRFYTYLSTLGHTLEAASENGKRVIVLDRPNPITGTHIEGPPADNERLSFTAFHPLPVRHGMTLGELARLIHAERRLTCDLQIIACENWHRADWYDTSGLVWTDPSPNMRSLTQATLYPGVGLLEMTPISVGRGTDTPFELVGAPYIRDPRDFAAALNDQDILGVRFIPIYFTPRASVHEGERCGGVRLLITDRNALDAVQVGMTIAIVLKELYREDWISDKLLTLLASAKTFQALRAGSTYLELAADWDNALQKFIERRQPYLLYS